MTVIGKLYRNDIIMLDGPEDGSLESLLEGKVKSIFDRLSKWKMMK